MSPQFNNLLFAFIKTLVCKVEALEDFRNVSHVKNVVTFSGSRQEFFLDL